MIYILIFFLVFVFFMILLIYLRKLQYDKTHQVLLDIVEEIGGKVIRKSIASQPIYAGAFQDKIVQITFSTDKINDKRVDYITISLVYPTHFNVNILSKSWLTKMQLPENDNDMVALDLDDILIKSDKQKAINQFDEATINRIKALYPFAHIVFSTSGVMFEKLSTNFIEDIEKDKVLQILDSLHEIAGKLA